MILSALSTVSALLALSHIACADTCPVQRPHGWPYGPFVTSGHEIINQRGQTVTYAGVNWPGHVNTMLPEGLQYASIFDIVSKIKSLGMNVIRLTYAIEMIDDIYDDNPDQTLRGTLVKVLGQQNGTAVLGEILKHNRQFNENTTRLQAFDAVAEECYNQQIYVHLDNHISNAEWCCIPQDGNGWWGDVWFSPQNWTRGLSFMADHGKNWPALTSMSLRNELRPQGPNAPIKEDYTWPVWFFNMATGADAIYRSNPDPLIFFSGLNEDTGLGEITGGQDLGNGTVFNLDDFAYSNKIVFELHDYSVGYTGNCSDFDSGLYRSGYDAMDTRLNTTAKNIAPVVLSEFGFPQDNTTYTMAYAQCIKEYLTSIKGGWMFWVLTGSYYIRLGVQDFGETWGLLNQTWDGWRNDAVINNYILPFTNASIS